MKGIGILELIMAVSVGNGFSPNNYLHTQLTQAYSCLSLSCNLI